MTTPTGTIALLDVQTEFGGSAPISLSEYYGGGGYVPSGLGVPSSGAISLSDLRGKTKPADPLPTIFTVSRSGGATNPSSVSISVYLSSIDPVAYSRTWSISYSLNGGAWTQTNLSVTSLTVNATASSAASVVVYSNVGSIYVSSLVARLTGPSTITSNTISGFYI